MPLLVVGSVALDTVETPHGKVEEVLGGSGVYFSVAASLFTDVKLAGVVGEDFPDEWREVLRAKGVDIAGLEVRPGRTFRWSGKYEGDMNEASTMSVELNVFGEYDGELPAELRDCEYLFLANGSPALQRRVLRQMDSAKLVVCDTMNHWISSHRGELDALLSESSGVVMNDGEAKMYTGEESVVRAGRRLLDTGVEFAVVKKGEHGALGVTRDGTFALPSIPMEAVKDPTGAGDSFGGGMMGYIAERGGYDGRALKKAVAYGCVVASFTVEDFSLRRLVSVTREDVEARLRTYSEMLDIDER